MLTAEERRDMLKLGYTVEEVDMMRIEIAQKLLAAKTKRPFGKQSMPESWKKTGGGRPKRKKTSASAFLCRAALFLGLAAAAAAGAIAMGLIELPDGLADTQNTRAGRSSSRGRARRPPPRSF